VLGALTKQTDGNEPMSHLHFDNPFDRRSFLAAGIGLITARGEGAWAQGEESDASLVEERDLAGLQVALETGKVSSRALVQAYLDRIEAIDCKGPMLNSVIEVNPEALAIAQELDRERKDKGPRGPLHGIPILLKDNIATGDRMETTAGSLALVGLKPPKDAVVAERLRQAGAVIMGKTNLSEWANARSSNSTSGWSGRGGLTKNPYALDRNPSGSSSGSGAAVAASLCAAAVGTETDGSILSPASANGVVGLKPTVGLVSRTGIIPISASQDTAGPMARTVRDAAILLGGMVGNDPDDKADLVSSRPDGLPKDYTKALQAGGLKGVRIGVARNFFNFQENVDPILAKALELLSAEGAVLVDSNDLPKGGSFGGAETIVLYYEMKAGLNAYFATLGPTSPIRTVEDVLAFNKKNAGRELQYFGQDFLEKVATRGDLDSKEYKDALARCKRVTRKEGLDQVMGNLKLDAVVGPCSGPPGVTDLVSGDRSSGGYDLISLAAVAGYPSISVPAGNLWGLPIAIAFAGRPWSEATLLKIAYGFEQAVKARNAPRFLPTVKQK